MSKGCIFCLFLPGIDLSSKKQLYSVIFVQHTVFITWKWNMMGRNSFTSLFSFLHTLLSPCTMTLWRRYALLLPPTLQGTLRHWQDSITLQVFNTLPQSPSLFTRAGTGSRPWPQKTHNPPPLHSTAAHWNQPRPPYNNLSSLMKLF